MEILQANVYPIVGVPLPSVGAQPPHEDFLGNVKGIRDCATQPVTGEGKEVVLVSHSYTGMPAAEALEGLGTKERQEKGLGGGVLHLIFIMGVYDAGGLPDDG